MPSPKSSVAALPPSSRWIGLALAVLLSACAVSTPEPQAAGTPFARRFAGLLPADAILLGEQHDAAEHHVLEFEAVDTLAGRRQLAALAIEMAEEGNGTAHLGATATEAQVQTALSWNEQAWAWRDYGAAVMAAVRAGVPVVGANLPRARMKDAMADVSLDAQLDEPARKAQQQAVREGHCNLLPETQIVPMTRIQIARDRAMAQAIVKARVPGKTVLLIAGAGHVTKALGVPQHLPNDLSVKAVLLQAGEAGPNPAEFDATWQTPPTPQKDYCATLRQQPRR